MSAQYSGMVRKDLLTSRKLVEKRLKATQKELALLDHLIDLAPKPMTLQEVEAQLGYKVKIT